ncbi:MAG: molecular chaperone [Acidimicrobiia bacterium]
MKRATGEERALARAAVYRLASLAFTYPIQEAFTDLADAAPVAAAGAELMDEATAAAVAAMRATLETTDRAALEAAHQHAFTLSYNADCPLYETAFSANHLFQQAHHQADISGFYQAFGIHPHGERPDHLALELEFMYLLTLKEATARERREGQHVAVCRSAQRTFLRDHLARWIPLAASRIALAGGGGFYTDASRLLAAHAAWEGKYLRLGAVELHRDEPQLIADEPGEMSCPLFQAADAPGVAGQGSRTNTEYAGANA